MNFAFDVFERNIDLELEDQQTWNLTFVFRREKESVSLTGGVRSFPPERKKTPEKDWTPWIFCLQFITDDADVMVYNNSDKLLS